MNNNINNDISRPNKTIRRRIKLKKTQKNLAFSEIKCPQFNETTNYFLEYWKMFTENEFILSKIKENYIEITDMKNHINELYKRLDDSNK